MRFNAKLPEGHIHHRILHLSGMHVWSSGKSIQCADIDQYLLPCVHRGIYYEGKTNSRNADVTHPITILMCTCKSKFAKNSKAEKAKNISENIIHQLLL